jgi:hypothetical protein
MLSRTTATGAGSGKLFVGFDDADQKINQGVLLGR